MATVNQYFDLTQQYIQEYGEKTILLMRIGGFFEVYDKIRADNQLLSMTRLYDFCQICELNYNNRNPGSEIVMAGFKEHLLDKYVKKLIDAGYTVPVYMQDATGSNITRSLFQIFSPGTYFQTETTQLTNNTACIWLHYTDNKILSKGATIVIGIANVDIYTGKVNLYQTSGPYKNSPTTYDELEKFLSIYCPNEVIFISNIPNEQEFYNVLNYCGVQCNLVHMHNMNEMTYNSEQLKNCEKQIYQREVLRHFYPNVDEYHYDFSNYYENDIATQAFCFLLNFLHKHNPNLIHKISEPLFDSIQPRLLLANHTLKQLNMIDDGTTSNKMNVAKMVNKCITAMGKRHFHYHLLYPTYDPNLLQKEYDITEHYLSKNVSISLEDLRQYLMDIKDLSKWERLIYIKKLPPKTFVTLYQNTFIIEELYDKLHLDLPTMDYLRDILDCSVIRCYCKDIRDIIKTYIDLEIAKDIDNTQDFDNNFICSGIFPELDKQMTLYEESYQKINAIKNYFHSLLQEKEKGKGKSEFVKLNETEKHNISLLCTSRRGAILKTLLPEEDKTISLPISKGKDVGENTFPFQISKQRFRLEKQSDKNANCYIMDSQIDGICYTISKIKGSMKDLILEEYQRFLTIFEEYLTKLDVLITFITRIDMIYAKAYLAKTLHYTKPILDITPKKSFVKIEGIRHALIEHLQNTEEIYIANDVVLGDGNQDGILLYGTNAVGKTCFIKSIGIAVLLAQAGLYVPCNKMIYKPYHHIFTRIIGNDNLFKGLSTFAVEMSELRTILKLADENSLVLGDELCSGTETLSAISIFVAGLQALTKTETSFIFATHLHEIVRFDEIESLTTLKIKHMSVVYDREKDVLVYDRKLLDGPGNNMYGLEVCKSLHLPDEFIKAAYTIRQKYCPEGGSLLEMKTSHFNSRKIMGICENCGLRPAKETHHLLHQSDAKEDGFIQKVDFTVYKNHVANLMNLCEVCHEKIHKEMPTGGKRVKTIKTKI